MDLPPETVVHTGHGEDTSIGAESRRLAGEPGAEPGGE